jgi:hypothetical protein
MRSEKSLGQILFEADAAYASMPFDDGWEVQGAIVQADFERRAAAVAAQVREQCAKACRDQGDIGGEFCAQAIEGMKP